VLKTIVGNQIQKQTEHGEVNLQMKRTYLYAQRSGSDVIEEIWCGQKMFKQSVKKF